MPNTTAPTPQHLCGLCVATTDDTPAPGTYRINGIGTAWLGSQTPCPLCGSRIRSLWFTVLWIPLIPLGKYRLLQRTALAYVGRKLPATPKPPAWWMARMAALPEGLLPLAVVKPRADNSAETNRRIGEVLQRWQSGQAQVPYIWGLDDMLAGQPPRSPCEYFPIPRSLVDMHYGDEAVALVMVQAGVATNAIGQSLEAALQEVKSSLYLNDLDNYCYQQR